MSEDTTHEPQGAPGTESGKEPAKAPAKEPAKAPTKEPRRAGKPKDPDAPGLVAVLRTRIAQVVWTVAVVCALFLAVGALLIALKANTGNALVRFVLDVADALDLQVFSRRNGVFEMTGADHATKNALANWGLAAVAYLVVGRIVDRVVRP
jgi:hypothetical protein